MNDKRKYLVRLRKVYRNDHGEITGSMPVKSFETSATTAKQAENNARHRFGYDGQQRRWKSVGFGEYMMVECLECRQIA